MLPCRRRWALLVSLVLEGRLPSAEDVALDVNVGAVEVEECRPPR